MTRAAVIVALVVLALVGSSCGQPPAGEHAGRAASDPMPAKQLWTCGMHPQVLQAQPGTCPICGMQLTPVSTGTGATRDAGKRTVLYWWDPMLSPPYISDQPGKSPMGMDLIPVYEDEVAGGAAVVIDPVVVQNMGVRVASVTEGPLRRTVRAVGMLAEAQPNQHDVNLRVSGWIEHLYADTEGMHLAAGAPLFDLYSPELHAAIDELIAARRAGAALPADVDGSARRTAASLADSAERKLQLWGLSQAQVRAFAARERAPEAVTFTSPISGHLIEKTVVDGAAVKAGDRILRIVDHSTLWLDAQVFEQQLPFVRIGQAATATVQSMPGERFAGIISFLHPHVEAMTRTAMARIVIDNPSLALRPGMYATVEIEAELAPRALLVPREAVIDSGTKQIAFVAEGGGHFTPRRLTLGVEGEDGVVQVLAGLAPNERVVTSGQFLLDAESRLREAIQKHLRDNLLQSPGAPHAH